MMTLRDDGSIDYDARSMRTAWRLCRAALSAGNGPAMRASPTGFEAGLRADRGRASSFISPNDPAA